jgi:thioredoxin reductase
MFHHDVAIIGAGVAGAFAALRFAEHHKNIKVLLLDLGRPPGKRRRQLEGWFGCFPTGDGKVYANDVGKVLEITDGRRTKAVNRWVASHMNEVNPAKLVKSKKPAAEILKQFETAGFVYEGHDYVQWRPDAIHQLSRQIAERVETAGNVTFSFDNEVFGFLKRNDEFLINTNRGEFHCKKIILCTGRSGWRWVNKLYRDFGILAEDDKAMFGITVELAAQYMKEFNHAHCSFKRNDLIVGPLSWGGSIIQEDHADLTVSAFRSNEDRWKSDKVFFSMIGVRDFKNAGCRQTDRLGKLGFLLAGDRVGREKIRPLVRGLSQLNLIPEYAWLPQAINELTVMIPNLVNRGLFHYPDILPLMSKVKLRSNLESEVDGLFIAGENAGISGIAAAAIMGGIAAESAVK